MNKIVSTILVIPLVLITLSILDYFFNLGMPNIIFNIGVFISLPLGLFYIKQQMKKNESQQKTLQTDNNELKSLCLKYEEDINQYKTQYIQYDTKDKKSIEKMMPIVEDIEYIFNCLPLIDVLLQSIPERTLTETEDSINKINILSDSNQKATSQAIEILKKVIGAGEGGKSFKYIEDSVMRVKEVINSIIDSVIESNKSEEEYLIQVESRINDIKDFTQKIEDIAESTHVLSINASIEAARSGKDAKGFSVIAAEIKKLSAESKSRVGIIKEMSTETVKAVYKLKNQYETTISNLTVHVKDSQDELGKILSILTDSYKGIANNMSMLSDASNINTNELKNIIYTYSQSQDVLTQQIDHIQKIFTVVNSKMSTIEKQLEFDRSKLDLQHIKQDVVSDVYNKLTMDYERVYIEKAVSEKLNGVSIPKKQTAQDVNLADRTSEIMGEDLSDSIVLF